MDPISITYVPHARELQISVTDKGEGFAQCRLPFRDELVGDPERGIVHGGVITTLMDTAGGTAVAMAGVLPQATLDLRIDYLRPATSGEDLYADAQVYRTTRHVAFVRGTCHHGDTEQPIANMTCTFIIADRPNLSARPEEWT